MKTLKESVTSESEITRLANTYRELMCVYNRKGRDCHWEITQRWSYGEEPKWFILHDGYICAAENFNSYQSALAGLKDYLEEAIKREVNWAESVWKTSEQWDQYSINNALRTLEIVNENNSR